MSFLFISLSWLSNELLWSINKLKQGFNHVYIYTYIFIYIHIYILYIYIYAYIYVYIYIYRHD